MIVVTGAAGFIGSSVVSELNRRGRKDIIAVDHVEDTGPHYDLKKKNLKRLQFQHYFEKHDFIQQVSANQIKDPIEAIIHMGACSSTTVQDEEYFQVNNLEYTQQLAQWALDRNVRFIYASSAATYGDGDKGYSDDHSTISNYEPLNLYGESKQKFDVWALKRNVLDRMVGLKFFNVFGPNEYHKDDMRSVVAKAYARVAEEGQMSLFKSYKDGYSDGEQKRDFIYIKDAVAVVLFFLEHSAVNGIFNVGTGQARSWNDLAKALFAAVGKTPHIDYIEMPEILKSRYQYFTQAEMQKLQNSGYTAGFRSLEDAVQDYALHLQDQSYW